MASTARLATGLARDSDIQIDRTPDDRIFIAPSLTWKPTAQTDWTVRLRYQKDRAGGDSGAMPWSGTVSPNPNGRFPTRLNPADPHADYFNTDSTSAGWSLAHRFNPDWKVRQTLRCTRSHQRYSAVDLRPSDDPAVSPYLDDAQRLLDRDGYFYNVSSRIFAADQNLQGRFDTGPVQHRVLAGLDLLRYRFGQYRASDSSDEPGSLMRPFDPFSSVYDDSYRPPAYSSFSRTRTTQMGLYLQDQLRWGPWGLIGGLRLDRVETRIENPLAGEVSTDKDRATTKRLGLLYDLTTNWTTWLSYGETFEPQGSSPSGPPLAPLRGKQWELGLRFVPPGERSRGLEVELVGEVTPSLSINASYNYSRILDEDELGGMPKRRAAIWGTKRFGPGKVIDAQHQNQAAHPRLGEHIAIESGQRIGAHAIGQQAGPGDARVDDSHAACCQPGREKVRPAQVCVKTGRGAIGNGIAEHHDSPGRGCDLHPDAAQEGAGRAALQAGC